MEQTFFYLMAGVAVVATIFAISEKHPVHAIVYLVTSLFALGVLFYLLAAPLIAMFEAIIYAGAIMVLFMFVIMMLDQGDSEGAERPSLAHCIQALILSSVTLVSLVLLILNRAVGVAELAAGPKIIGVKELAITLFSKYGVAIELISMQLLFAVVGVLYLGRRRKG